MPLIASLIRSRAVPSPSYVKRTVTSHSKPRAAESLPRRPGARMSSPTGGSRTGSETGPRRPQARDLSGVLLERRSSDEELLSSVRPLTRRSERAAGHRRACGRLASTHRERGLAGTTERQMPADPDDDAQRRRRTPAIADQTSKRDEVGVVVHTKILLLRSET